MAVRRPDRPKDPEAGTKQRATRPPDHTLSVTVSIGAAERSERDPVPALVLRSADEALYRAKRAGRNRLSR
jgi:diguanylate cyclase (GGDEF)-like protein